MQSAKRTAAAKKPDTDVSKSGSGADNCAATKRGHQTRKSKCSPDCCCMALSPREKKRKSREPREAAGAASNGLSKTFHFIIGSQPRRD